MIQLTENHYLIPVPKEAHGFKSKASFMGFDDIRQLRQIGFPFRILLTVTKDEIIGDLAGIAPHNVYALIQSKDVWFENPIPEPEMQGGYDENGNGVGGYDPAWVDEWNTAQQKVIDKAIIIEKI